MQSVTQNRISQAQHGPYKAVDYSASPDPYLYAAEDGTVTLVDKVSDDSCGKRIWVNGKTGRVGICHIETFYVKQGQKVKRGQKLAKMGYTGLTIPKGPAGRHAHVVLELPDGSYTYFPSKVNQKFIKLGEDKMITESQSEVLYRMYVGTGITPTGRKNIGKKTWEQERKRLQGSKTYKSEVERVKKGGSPGNHLPSKIRAVYKHK